MYLEHDGVYLRIPEGARVHITIGHAGAIPSAPAGGTERPPAPRLAGPILKSVAVGVLLFGAFAAGRFFPGGAGVVEPLIAANQRRVAAATEPQAFPEQALPSQPRIADSAPAPAAAPPQAQRVPPELARLMRQQPAITPPPGQAQGAPAKNAFGLDD